MHGVDPWVKTDARLRACVPPYAKLTRFFPTEAPSLGTIIVAHKLDWIDSIQSVNQAVKRWPWVIPLIVLSSQSVRSRADGLVSELPLLRDRVALVHSQATRDVVLKAVKNRELPAAEVLGGYAARRLGQRNAGPLLTEQFRKALVPDFTLPRSRSTYSRFFRTLTPLSPRDWRALATLAHGISAVQRSGIPPIPIERLRSYSNRYLGVGWKKAIRYLGWEAVIEQAISRVGS